MYKYLKLNLIAGFILLLAACGDDALNKKKPPAITFETTEWTALLPKDDLDALLNPPDYLNSIEEGSSEDQIERRLKSKKNVSEQSSRYEQALHSMRVIPAMDGKAVRIPGFVVPLEFGGEQVITKFFLVPFFGACMHLPPPPPNQVIYVEPLKGFKLDALYEPFWVSGILKIETIKNETAKATYSMVMHDVEPYTEDNALPDIAD